LLDWQFVPIRIGKDVCVVCAVFAIQGAPEKSTVFAGFQRAVFELKW
jgi:hypothetical protein